MRRLGRPGRGQQLVGDPGAHAVADDLKVSHVMSIAEQNDLKVSEFISIREQVVARE